MWEEHRCHNCDSRWCDGAECGIPGNVYVVSVGWRTPAVAGRLEANGYRVHWNEKVSAA